MPRPLAMVKEFWRKRIGGENFEQFGMRRCGKICTEQREPAVAVQ